MDAFLDGFLFGLGFVLCLWFAGIAAYIHWNNVFRD